MQFYKKLLRTHSLFIAFDEKQIEISVVTYLFSGIVMRQIAALPMPSGTGGERFFLPDCCSLVEP
jgi:hypothetical protein